MYINSFCSISPSGTLTNSRPYGSLTPIEGDRAYCDEPDYSGLIPPMQLRRMTKPVRTGVAAAKICLQEGGIGQPGSIHVGTAYGMLLDSEVFLQKMIEQDEKMLTPTAFIQSTHNTVSGQIALSIAANVHNMTYVHRGHSFESALLNASLLLQEEGGNALVGAVEECTDTSFHILNRFPRCRNSAAIGEGAAFFQLRADCDQHSLARIEGCSTFVTGEAGIDDQVRHFLEANNLSIAASDHVYAGYDRALLIQDFAECNTVHFKDFCGSFPTASSFALALTLLALQQEQQLQRCWIINQTQDYWSIMAIGRANTVPAQRNG